MLGGLALFNRQRLLPVLPIFVFEQHGDGRTDRFAMAHAGQNVSFVGLDLHSAAAAIALLTSP